MGITESIASVQWDIYFTVALIITVFSHFPRLLEGERVLSESGNFWTPVTIALHLITGIFLIMAYISWNAK